MIHFPPRPSLVAAAAALVAGSFLPLRAQAAEPTKSECIASSEKGQELRRTDKLTAARAQLVTCISTACPGPVREDCAQRLSELDAAMPAIEFEVKDAKGNDLGAVRVFLDGQMLTDHLRGAAIPIDPGEHRLVFRAEGKRHVERTVIIRERDKARVEHIVMEDAPAPEEPAPNPASVAPMAWPTMKPAATAPTETQPPATGGRKLTPLFFAAAGVAVVGLGVGIGAGVASTSSHTSLQNECTGNDCPPTAQGDLDSFHTLRTVSDIGYVVGAAGVVGAAFLFFTAPRKPATPQAARIWLGPTSAGVAGTF
jgi:hypothetical protein